MAYRKDREFGVTLWESAWDISKKMPIEDARKFVHAFVAYGYGEDVEESSEPWYLAFCAFTYRIDMWREKVERNREIARSRTKAAPDGHQTGTRAAPDGHQTGTRAAPDGHQTGTEIEKEIEKEIEVEVEDVDEMIESSFHSDSINESIPLPPSSKKPSKKRKAFVPPQPSEVEDYARSRGKSIDGERFCDFYASKGWTVGNSPMKDWKASVRTWLSRENAGSAGRGSPKPDFSEYGKNVTKVSNEGWV